MTDDKWLTLTAGLAVSLLILTVGACEIYQSRLIADMVRDGADPVRASCAFALEKRYTPACIAPEKGQ